MSSSDEEFFRTPKAAAIFKHAVLDQYLTPYAMKTGLRPPNRVAFIDGYAGPGVYEDGTPGSPARTIDTAVAIADKRQLECHFIEKKELFLDSLRAFIADRASSVPVTVYDGDVNAHIQSLIDATKNVPTLIFLDPFGLVIPFDSVRRLMDRPRGIGMPNAEVLINFSMVGLRRIGGLLSSDNPVRATLERMDAVCGGDWWREMWLENSADSDRAEELVTEEYARRLAGSGAGGYGWWTVDVRNRPNYKPAYYLVFLTRHRDGLELFGESASLALQKWRERIFEEDNSEYALFGSTEEDLKEAEAVLAKSWSNEIEENCRRLLRERGSFIPGEFYGEVFGATLGKAREKHLRTAWRSLFSSGETVTDPTGKKLFRTRIDPPVT